MHTIDEQIGTDSYSNQNSLRESLHTQKILMKKKYQQIERKKNSFKRKPKRRLI